MSWWSTLSWLLWKLSVGTVTLYGVVLASVVFFQERLIYVPAMAGLSSAYSSLPSDWGMEYEDVWITSADGTKLHSWLMWPEGWSASMRASQPVLVFFQENAGNMSYRLHFLSTATRALHCGAFILGYRGYGRSRGKPSEAGLCMDAEAALEHLSKRSDIPTDRLVLMGRSLGGALAVHAAVNVELDPPLAGIIVENTFCSILELAPKVLPFLKPVLGPKRPFNFLLRNHWKTEEIIKGLADKRVLLLSSLKDEMLDPEDMQRLYRSHGKAPWKLVTFSNAAHMDAYLVAQKEYWAAMRSFMNGLFESDE